MAEKIEKNSRRKTRQDEKPKDQTIREKAYEIYEKRGEEGKDLDNWLEAEKLVNGEEG